MSDATVGSVLTYTAEVLSRAGIDTPRLDAELLMGAALGVDRAQLVIDAREPFTSPAVERFHAMLTRRVAREPVAYILGTREFRHITLAVDRRALIPRPETELLVEVGLGLPASARVIDVGTGSGAVALALASERPDLDVIGTDLSADAVELAQSNAVALGLSVEFVCGDLLAGLSGEAALANLPYVPEEAVLAPEIADYEPASALYAGGDGLDAIRALVASLPADVRLVALEHGAEQGGQVGLLLATGGFGEVETLRDLAGHERVTVGRR